MSTWTFISSPLAYLRVLFRRLYIQDKEDMSADTHSIPTFVWENMQHMEIFARAEEIRRSVHFFEELEMPGSFSEVEYYPW